MEFDIIYFGEGSVCSVFGKKELDRYLVARKVNYDRCFLLFTDVYIVPTISQFPLQFIWPCDRFLDSGM